MREISKNTLSETTPFAMIPFAVPGSMRLGVANRSAKDFNHFLSFLVTYSDTLFLFFAGRSLPNFDPEVLQSGLGVIFQIGPGKF